MSLLLKAVPSLFVGSGGAGLAYLWFEVNWVLAAVVAITVVAGGMTCDLVASWLLARDRAVAAVRWLDGWLLAMGGFAALAAALGIVLAVEFEPSANASVETKKLSAAILAALAAFLTTVIIKGAEGADEEWVGARAEKLFKEHFRGRFPRNPDGTASDAQNALSANVWRGTAGWGRAARRKRAEDIQAALSAG